MSSDKSTGQWVGSVVGAVVGFVASGYNPAGAFKGAVIGAGLAGYIDPPKGPGITGPRITDLYYQYSTYGQPLPRADGVIARSGSVIWVENNRLKEVVKKEKVGGKGGGSSQTLKTFSYFATFAVAFNDGPIGAVRRIWLNNQLFYDAGSDDPGTLIASNQNSSKFKIYFGTDDQMPDPRIEAEMGFGVAPAFRGTAYIVFLDLPLEKFGNSLVGLNVKIETYPTELIPAESCPLMQALTSPLPGSYGGSTTRQALSLAYVNGRLLVGANGSVFNYTLDGVLISHVTTLSDQMVNYPAPPNGPGGFAVCEPKLECQNDPYSYLVGNNDIPYFFGLVDGGVLVGDAIHSYGRTMCRIGDNLFMAGNGGIVSSKIGGILLDGDINSPNHAALMTDDYYLFALTVSKLIKFDISEGFYNQLNQWNIGLTGVSQGGDTPWMLDENTMYGSADELSGVFNKYTLGSAGGDDFILSCTVSDSGPVVRPIGCDFWFSHNHIFLTTGVSTGESSTPLAEVLNRECLRSEYITGADLDLSLITENIRGRLIAGITSPRDAISPLQGAYAFDVVSSGYKIKFIPRGQSSILDIPINHLGARDFGASPSIQLNITREMDSQLPRMVRVAHIDPFREYDKNEQFSTERLSANTTRINQLEMPVSLSPDEAAMVAQKLFDAAWLQRSDFKFSLPPPYRYLEPTDVVRIVDKNEIYELIIIGINYGLNGILEVLAKPNSAAIWSPVAAGGSGSESGGTIELLGASVAVLMDIPCVIDQMDTPGITAAMFPVGGNAWHGGVLMASNDNGQTFDSIEGFSSPCTVAAGVDVLPEDSGHFIDRISTLNIRILAGQWDGITEQQMMTGKNYCAYGIDGRWELLQFANSILEADGTYTLSIFVRGLRGTEWATALHEIDDFIVLLDDPDTAFINLPLAIYGVERFYKAVSVGTDAQTADPFLFAYRGVNLKPLSVVQFKGAKLAGDWVISFEPRTRLQSSQWVTGQPAPIGETEFKFEIQVLDDIGDLVESYIIDALPWVYTVEEQIADFGEETLFLNIVVYQISSRVGRGYPAFSEFTSIAGDPYWANVISLLNLQVSLNDDTGRVWTPSGVELVAGALAIVDANDTMPTVYDVAFNWWQQPYTIEAYINCTAYGGDPFGRAFVISQGAYNPGNYDWWFGPNSAGKLVFGYWGGSRINTTGATTVGLGVWRHIQMTFDGTTIRIFIDGALDMSAVYSTIPVPTGGQPVRIGANGAAGGGSRFIGSVKGVRFTRGVARAVGNFTPPTLPLPNF